MRNFNKVGPCSLMVAHVLRRLHDTTRELFVLVMREGVRDTTGQRVRMRETEREIPHIPHWQMRTARVVDGFPGQPRGGGDFRVQRVKEQSQQCWIG